MSKLKVDTLEGKASATSITLPTTTNIGSTPLVSASANSMTIKGEGSETTNIQQGLCKAWVHWNKQASPEKQDSFNISAVNDVSQGKTSINFNNDFVNNDYACVMYQNGHTGVGTGDFNNESAGGLLSRATGSVACVAYDTGLVDAGLNDVIAHGDLA